MLFTTRWAPGEVSEATIVCYLRYFGRPGRYRRPRLHAIYNTLGPQGGIGGHGCMLFTILWAPREVSEATIACYLRHAGPPGRYRRPRLYAIYDTLGPQGGIGGHDCMLFTTLWAPREVSDREHVQGWRQVKGYIHRSRTDAASAFLNMYGLLQPWS